MVIDVDVTQPSPWSREGNHNVAGVVTSIDEKYGKWSADTLRRLLLKRRMNEEKRRNLLSQDTRDLIEKVMTASCDSIFTSSVSIAPSSERVKIKVLSLKSGLTLSRKKRCVSVSWGWVWELSSVRYQNVHNRYLDKQSLFHHPYARLYFLDSFLTVFHFAFDCHENFQHIIRVNIYQEMEIYKQSSSFPPVPPSSLHKPQIPNPKPQTQIPNPKSKPTHQT